MIRGFAPQPRGRPTRLKFAAARDVTALVRGAWVRADRLASAVPARQNGGEDYPQHSPRLITTLWSLVLIARA